MTDIKLKNNDILFEDNDIVLISGDEETAQRLNIKLVALLNDWFLDINYGTDWRGLLSNRATKSLIDVTIKRIILSDEGVKSISSYRSTSSNGELSVYVLIVSSLTSEQFSLEVSV